MYFKPLLRGRRRTVEGLCQVHVFCGSSGELGDDGEEVNPSHRVGGGGEEGVVKVLIFMFGELIYADDVVIVLCSAGPT